MVIYLTQISVTFLLLVAAPGGVVGCQPDGSHWIFKDCNSLILMWAVHTIATMQTASMSRNVFIKTIKDVKETEDYKEADNQSSLVRESLAHATSFSVYKKKREVIS